MITGKISIISLSDHVSRYLLFAKFSIATQNPLLTRTFLGDTVHTLFSFGPSTPYGLKECTELKFVKLRTYVTFILYNKYSCKNQMFLFSVKNNINTSTYEKIKQKKDTF